MTTQTFRMTLLALLLAASTSVSAHHSVSAMFDTNEANVVKVTGVISKVAWINPHIYFMVDTTENGQPVTWRFENFPPSWWKRFGYGKDTFKVGDKVTVEGYKAKNGTPHLAFGKTIHFPDGTTIATMKDVDVNTVR